MVELYVQYRLGMPFGNACTCWCQGLIFGKTNTCFRRHPHPRPVPERAPQYLGVAVQVRIGVFDHIYLTVATPPLLRSLENLGG